MRKFESLVFGPARTTVKATRTGPAADVPDPPPQLVTTETTTQTPTTQRIAVVKPVRVQSAPSPQNARTGALSNLRRRDQRRRSSHIPSFLVGFRKGAVVRLGSTGQQSSGPRLGCRMVSTCCPSRPK